MTPRASSILGEQPGPFDVAGEFGALPPPEEPKQELLNDGKPVVPPPTTTAAAILDIRSDLQNRGEQYTAQQNLLNAVMDTLDRVCDDLALRRTDWAAAARGEKSDA
jgi:hypothetical protein